MSNRLSIEVQHIKVRHFEDEPYNEIAIMDNHEVHGIYLNQDEAPTNPGELLLQVFKEAQNGVFYDIIQDHINQSSGLEIEGDWIEWNDPKIKIAMDFWKEPDKNENE
jgi:hypothetical protein